MLFFSNNLVYLQEFDLFLFCLQIYADGTSVYSNDFGDKVTPNAAHTHGSNLYYHRIFELSDQINMKKRHPSSKCFVRAWGNKTDEILQVELSWISTSGTKTNVVCQGTILFKNLLIDFC